MEKQCNLCPPGGQDRDGLSRLSFTSGPDDRGVRLDRYLALKLADSGISREKTKQLIRSGKVKIGRDAETATPVTSPKESLKSGLTILVEIPETAGKLEPEAGDLEILYEDKDLAVINKPAGLTVHPCPSCTEETLAHRLVARFSSLRTAEGFRPGIVHRLDKDTSGLMIAALNEHSRLALSALFAKREVHKEYLALVRGAPRDAEGIIEEPIGRHPTLKTKMAVVKNGKPAKSAWRKLYADPQERFSLLAVRIFTGRTHQIRVHMAYLGYPLLGDKVYGKADARPKQGKSAGPTPAPKALPAVPRQMLHAWKLAFEHPTEYQTPAPGTPAAKGPTGETGEHAVKEALTLRFTAPPPADFIEVATALSASMQRLVITGLPGCGKSSLTRELAALGIATFSADAEVARLYAPKGQVWAALYSRYGSRFVPSLKEGVDKKALGEAMRESPGFKREMEDLVHPLVMHGLEEFWAKEEAAKAPAAVAEIPLFLESGFHKNDARVLLAGVSCPFETRRLRLKKNRNWPDEVIASMDSWQWPEKDKMAACDFVVDNSGPESALRDGALALARELGERRAKDRENLAALFDRLYRGDWS